MAGAKQAKVEVVWQRITVIERFASVLYPLDVFELLKQLPDIHYVVPALPELARTGTIEATKAIASKGDVGLVINMENKTLGVQGSVPEKTVESFRELRQFYLERLDPSPGLATHYVEFNGQGWARSEANPTEVCTGFWASHLPLHNLGKLLDAEVTNFGLQLAPPNKDPNGPDWFHVYIEPLIPSSSRRYRIQYIQRGTDVERLLQNFSRVNITLKSLISQLERY